MTNVSEKSSIIAPKPFGVFYANMEKYGERPEKKNGMYIMNIPPRVDFFINANHKVKNAQPKKLFNLPPAERKRSANGFGLEYDNNKNFGTIKWDEKIIVLEGKLKHKPLHFREFVLGHELGHQHYKNEHFCDLYSANRMLKKGYNKEQILEAAAQTRGRYHALTKKLKSKL